MFLYSGVGESQVEAFDLDAISGGSNINFGVDDSLSGVSGAAIGKSLTILRFAFGIASVHF